MRLSLVYVHRHIDQFQQLNDPWNVVAKDLAAGMILMRMRDEHLGEGVAVLLGRLHNALNLPGWIDYCRLARCRIADEIDVVLHRPAFHLLQVECVCHRLALSRHIGNGASRSLCMSPIIRYFQCPVCLEPMFTELWYSIVDFSAEARQSSRAG